jgi:DNA-binding transcriptional LysR family regulator
VVITAPGDPLAGARAVAVEALADRPWLLREHGSGTRALCEEFLQLHELRPPVLTLGSNGAIKHAAARGLGVSLQSAQGAALELRTGVLATIPVREGLPQRQWFVLTPATGPIREPVRAFVEFATSETARAALQA